MIGEADRLRASLLTPAGVGAIAVVRLSGRDARSTLCKWFVPKHTSLDEGLAADRLYFGRFVDGDETIDETIVAVRADARLGDVIDVAAHGGVRVVERILQTFERIGAVVSADPVDERGGRTLIEGEAMDALCRAKTRRAVRFLALQRVVLPRALEEIADTCAHGAEDARKQLQALHARSKNVRFLIDGATFVFIGQPNAGKSTLVNRLFEGSRSLVSPRAGTTRAWVEVSASLDGIPVTVIDTAGFADEAGEGIESEAIRRSVERCRDADVIVVVMDGSVPFPATFLDRTKPMIDPSHALLIRNKSDLPAAWDHSAIDTQGLAVVATSGLTGAGLPELRTAMAGLLGVPEPDCGEAALFTERQREWVERALSDAVDSALGQAIRGELICPIGV
ncbi:MAG: 50S ribosome-binding GTPase [Planctomycetes bacterium]|nr:50S ribosome-binding GTPase [Planctomycetota bacterium]